MGMLKGASWLVVMHNGMVWRRIRLRTSPLRTFGSNLRFRVPGNQPWREPRGLQRVRHESQLQKLQPCRPLRQPRAKAIKAMKRVNRAWERAKEATVKARQRPKRCRTRALHIEDRLQCRVRELRTSGPAVEKDQLGESNNVDKQLWARRPSMGSHVCPFGATSNGFETQSRRSQCQDQQHRPW